MLAQVRRKPREASRYLGLAQRCAKMALGARVAVAVGAGVKSVQEADRAGVIGLRLEGYASRYGETDLDGETMAPGAFDQIREEWASTPEPPILFDHGQDPDLRRRPIGYATDVTVDPVGLYVEAFIPREPDPGRFSGVGRKRYGEVYNDIRTGEIDGYSVQGSRLLDGKTNRWWSTGEVSVTSTPCLVGARFVLSTR